MQPTPEKIVLTKASITGFEPTQGGPGTSVTVTGSNLSNVIGVSFDGVPATNFGGGQGTSVHCVVPSGATTGPITVDTAVHGSATSSRPFTVMAGMPSITGFFPPSGRRGTLVVFTGLNLTGITAVLFNGKTAQFTPGNGEVTATVPVGATTGRVTIKTTHGNATTAQPFVVLP